MFRSDGESRNLGGAFREMRRKQVDQPSCISGKRVWSAVHMASPHDSSTLCRRGSWLLFIQIPKEAFWTKKFLRHEN